MVKWDEWLEGMMRDGHVCADYTRSIVSAIGKQDIFDLCLDANGMDFMCRMSAIGDGLPYGSIRMDFERYVNGRYEAARGKGSMTYTGEMWIGKGGDVNVTCTATLLLACKGMTLHVPPHSVCAVYVDSESEVEVDCPSSSRAYVSVYGKGKAYSMTGKNVDMRRICGDGDE